MTRQLVEWWQRCKRWRTKTTTDAVLYTADMITPIPGEARQEQLRQVSDIVEEIANPLGVVPVVAFRKDD